MSLNGPVGLGLVLTAKDLASGVLRDFKGAVTEAHGAASQAANGVTKAFADFGRGASVMGVGIAGLAALYPTIQVASEFGQKIAEISTLTDEASLSYGALADQVLALNATYGGGTAKQAKALYDGISAGAANAAEAGSLLDASNKLAVAGVTEVNVALDGLTSSLNAYGVSFSQANTFSDAMFTAVKKGKTTIGELSGVIGRVAPTASALGISFDDLNASIAAVTLKGLKTEEAATGLKAAFANIIAPTANAEKEAKRLGVTFDAATLRAKGFPAFLEQITSSADFNADSLQQLFSSTEALNAVLALTANGSSAFNGALDAMRGKTGATSAAFEKMSATLAFQQKRFDGLIENAKVVIGSALEPLVALIVRGANALLDRFNAMNPVVRDFVVRAFAAASAVLAVLGAVMAAKAGVAILSAALAAGGASFGAIALSAGGALLVIGAIGAAVYGLKVAVDRNLGGIGDTFTSAVRKLGLAYDALVQLFTQGGFSGAVRDEMAKAENSGVRAFAIKVFLWVERIRNFFGGVADGFSAALDAAKPAFAGFSLALDGLASAFGVVAETPKEAGAAFDAFGSTGATVGKAVGKGLELVVSLLTTIMKVVAGVKSAFTFDDVSDGVVGAFTSIKAAISDVWESVVGLTGGVATGSDTWKTLGRVLGFVVVGALRAVQNTIQTVGNFFADVLTGMAGAVNVIGGLLTGNWSRVWLGLKQIAYGVIHSVIDGLLSFVQVAASALDQLSVIGGNKSHLADDVSKYRSEVRDGMRESFGLDQPLAPPPVANTAPGGLGAAATATSNAALSTLASGLAQPTATVDPSAVAAMQASADATLALAKRPVVVQVDGRDLASSVDSANTSDAARSFSSEAPATG